MSFVKRQPDGTEVRVVMMAQDHADNFKARRRRRHSSGERETWSRKVEYFFASLGYAVGLGNIWRFPYLCYRNGGGAFLIPYLLALLSVGFPIMFMEMAVGQFASVGTISIWKVSPLFKGIGYAIVVVLMLVNTYYNVLIAYALFYLFASITSELPWANCDNKWNTRHCIADRADRLKLVMLNRTANATAMNVSSDVIRRELKTPTEEFFERHLLKMSPGIDTLGDVQWPLIVCLGVSWFTCFMCLFKGIKSMGKVVIFTTAFSYIILTVLFVRGITLEGALDGIIYYLKPDFQALSRLQVWGEASAQAFASLTLGGGGWITLSSYNKFNNKCHRDAIIVGVGNALTSIYAGLVIFSVLGYMSFIKGVPMQDVTNKGPGLAFVAYPEGLALIPGAPFWSICFFFMMFTVGLDSLFGQVETIAAAIIDEYPDVLRPNRKLFLGFLCIFMFAMGIPLVTEGGIYIVTLMDWYTLLFSFSIISLFEVFVFMYVYGYQRFAEDIEMMIGQKPWAYFMVTWRFVSPVVLMLVIAFLAAFYVPAYYGPYFFPPYAESIGWAIALLPTTLIPLVAVVQFFRLGGCGNIVAALKDAAARRLLKQRLLDPTEEWGPALPEIRRKFSYGSRSTGTGLKKETGDDDVFGGGDTEMATVKGEEGKEDEKVHLVKFKDDEKKEAAAAGDAGDVA